MHSFRHCVSLLVADALVGLVADVHDATSVGVTLHVGAVRMLELAASLDGADAATLPGVLSHNVFFTSSQKLVLFVVSSLAPVSGIRDGGFVHNFDLDAASGEGYRHIRRRFEGPVDGDFAEDVSLAARDRR